MKNKLTNKEIEILEAIREVLILKDKTLEEVKEMLMEVTNEKK